MPSERSRAAGPSSASPRRLATAASPWLVAPALLACATIISWVFASRRMPSPDEGAAMTSAAKILDGLVFYRDIDSYPFPGSSYLLALAMAIFGEHVRVARALDGAMFCVVVLGSYAAALALLDRRRAALFGFALLGLKYLAFPMFTMYYHSDVALAACVVALAVFLRHDPGTASRRLVVSGFFVGLAIVTKQNAGLYLAAAMACVISWPGLVGLKSPPWTRRLAELTALSAGIVIPVGIMTLYFAREGLLEPMIVSGLLRPFTGYMPLSGVSFSSPLRWWEFGTWDFRTTWQSYQPLLYVELLQARTLPYASWRIWELAGETFGRVLYSSMIVTAIACVWLRWRAHGSPATADGGLCRQRARFFVTVLLSAAIVASAFPRADLWHVLPVYPLVLLTALAIVSGASGIDRRSSKAPWALGIFVAAELATCGALTLLNEAQLTRHVVLDRADLRVRSQDAWMATVVRAVKEELPPGAPLFVYGHEAQFYFLTDHYSPWPFSQLYPGMAGGDQGAPLARWLEETKPPIVLMGWLRVPGLPPLKAYTGKVVEVAKRNYRDGSRAFFAAHPEVVAPSYKIFKLWRRR